MLNARTEAFLDALCGVYARQGYKVRDWEDLATLLPEQEREQVREYVRDLREDGYLAVKYCDEEEICFSLTDRGNRYAEETAAREVGKFASLAPSVRAQAESDVIATEEKVSKRPKGRIRTFLWGLLGGFVGGGIAGAIVATIAHLWIGG